MAVARPSRRQRADGNRCKLKCYGAAVAAAPTLEDDNGYGQYFEAELQKVRATIVKKLYELFQPARIGELTRDEFSRRYGWPDSRWDDVDWLNRPTQFYYGPMQFEHPTGPNGVRWQFYRPLASDRTVVVRVGGGDHFALKDKGRLLDEATAIAAERYQRLAWEAPNEMRRQAHLESARQQEAMAAHQAWIDKVQADRDRVIAELRADRDAKLNDWASVEGWSAPAFGREERDQLLAQASISIQFTEAAMIGRREARATKARMERLSKPIRLVPSKTGIIFGTARDSGEDLVIPVQKIQHLLIGGMTGSGKSVFLHQLAYQLLRSDEVNRVVLVDLKGGTEFDRYSKEPKAVVLWEFRDVLKLFDELVELLDVRETEMRQKGLRSWPGSRVFVIVDEYAEIHDSINDAKRGEMKEAAGRLANNLKRIIRRARSLGVVMVCALQKPTTDAMDSTLRANMNFRACFRVKTRQSVEAALDDYDDLPIDPLTLHDGQFVFDSGRGEHIVLQAQIAPGVELGGGL